MLKITAFIWLMSVIFSNIAHAETYQSHESIAEAVKSYIAQNINSTTEYETIPLPIDERLNLPQCAEPLEIFATTDTIKAGRLTVGVRCNRDNKWTIYTSVIIKTYQLVVVLTIPVQRGEIITQQHLAFERREVSNLRENFATQIEQVVNKQATRQLEAGTVISLMNHLAEPKIIKRGDKVVISSSNTNFSIKMSGIAMMDGTKGQLIKVKNQNSGRIINATVVEPGLVVVNN